MRHTCVCAVYDLIEWERIYDVSESWIVKVFRVDNNCK